jgi:hypothetical protein
MNYFILVENIVVIGLLALSWLIARLAASRASSPSHAPRRRNIRVYVQIVGLIVLIGVALVPLGFLDSIVIGAPFQTLTYSGLQSASNPQLQDQAGCPDPSGVELVLAIQGLNTAQATANVDMALCVGDQVLKNLTIEATGARPLANGLVPSPANAKFLLSSFRVSYYGSTPQTYMTRSVTIESILQQTDPTGEIRVPVDLGVVSMPVFGNVISYPFDSYSAAGAWQVFPPSGTAIINDRGIRFSWTPFLAVASTPDSGNLAWRAGYAPEGYVIEASRIPSVKFFVFLIAGLPLLLFAGLLALVLPLVNDPERRRFPAELLVGVGAFLLAIIPVRAVLVPAEISQITLVDYILGTEMAVMVAGSLIIVLAGLLNPGVKAARIPGEDASRSNSEPSAVTPRRLPRHAEVAIVDSADSRSRDTAKRRNEFIRRVLPGMVGAAALVSIWRLLNRARKL